MAIVKLSLHGLNLLRCFCWGPTRPGTERSCVQAGSARRSASLRHRAEVALERDERPLAAKFSVTAYIHSLIHSFILSFSTLFITEELTALKCKMPSNTEVIRIVN